MPEEEGGQGTLFRSLDTFFFTSRLGGDSDHRPGVQPRLPVVAAGDQGEEGRVQAGIKTPGSQGRGGGGYSRHHPHRGRLFVNLVQYLSSRNPLSN